MSGRTTWSFLLPVLAILLVLAVGVVILVSVGLRQTDVLHQIILVGLGVVLFGFGVMLLTLAVAGRRGKRIERGTPDGAGRLIARRVAGRATDSVRHVARRERSRQDGPY